MIIMILAEVLVKFRLLVPINNKLFLYFITNTIKYYIFFIKFRYYNMLLWIG